ncbi:glycosyltransferase [Tundrisphaera lichenicola]|uniref:glycosyltransferase n=1 Tax=Tundrisphaera lichenicola TaxID=2029860 RepID=UPI003EBDEC42
MSKVPFLAGCVLPHNLSRRPDPSGPQPLQSFARRLASAPRAPRPVDPVPVALVITDLDVGGAERALVALASGLDRRRWSPSVVALGGEGALAAPLRESGIPVESLDVDPRRPDRAVRSLAGTLRRTRPRLVQSFLFHANVAAKLAGPMAGHPWVVGGLRVAERRKGWHLRLDRLTSRLSCGSVCVSEGVRRFSIREGGLDPDRLTVIPNGVDPAPFDRAELADRASLGVPPDAFLTLYVGRLDPQKGLPTLIEAASKVAALRPDWHLVLVGDGPDRGALQARIDADIGLNQQVHMIGRRDDVPSLLRSADLLVLPSLWEGMPNAILEAMAAGRAVVGTSVEGTEDLVIPGRTGWLVPPSDAMALADALVEAASDPGRLRRFGEAARGRIEAEFTPTRMVEAYEQLWSRLLGYAITP